MAYTYDKQLWKDYPDTSTPITADRLNHMENGIKGLSDAQVSIEVVDSLDGNSTTNAPSVRAVNEGLEKIIESGDGYVKYSNGTMICYADVIASSNLQDYWGQFKKNSILITFPQTFISAPSVNVNSINAEQHAQISASANNITTTGFTAIIYKPSSASTIYSNITYVAIGKWK